MTFKTIAIALSIVAICSVPAHAGSFGVYGSRWDSKASPPTRICAP